MKEGMNLSLEDQIFENHYNYYKNVGIETIKINSGQIDQVSSDYQGRVLYELLQNAFDKANKNILVQVKGNSLYVANDGSRFTYNANHDYVNGSTHAGIFKRYDFQSICSISTSTKNASESIGNKGVGFKSVYSIASYANIYTQGNIIDGEKTINETISFRLFDSFKNIETIPDGFDDSIKKRICECIIAVQKEGNLTNRGVPGYYFPLHITNEAELYVKELFQQGYVTIIEIPVSSVDKIKELFEEIQDNHFQFVQIKYPDKNFEVTFDFEGAIQKHIIERNSKFFLTSDVSNPQILELAKSAGVNVELPKVAVYIKDTPNGKLYNYLSTKKKSPFKYIDFHADFHTKVDRTEVNFDSRTPIGKYNSALLNACVELYFTLLNSFVKHCVELDCSYLSLDNLSEINFEEFNWRMIELQDSDSIYHNVRKVLKISDRNYENASILFSKIAKRYFNVERNTEEYISFYQNIGAFIHGFTDDAYKQYKRSEIFKNKLGEKLIENSVRILPKIEIETGREIVFRKKSDKKDSSFILPDFLGINITEFEITDEYFRKESLKIKDFNDYNELLKYFKQCSFTGEYNQVSLLDEQQQDLIRCLYLIFEAKKEQSFLTTHRFTKAANSKLREDNSTLNQANFNISTIFLKTNNQRYKPAQLCTIGEIDTRFINGIIPLNQISIFLKFLGVSTDSKYLFVDSRMYSKLKDGLDFIPALIDRKDEKIDDELIRNFFVITPNGKQVHPAIINDNNYKFLESISYPPIKDDLDNIRVKKYFDFPNSYKSILKNRISENLSHKNDIIRFYQNVFTLYQKENNYLIIENGHLSWTSATDFAILNNKADFDLLTKLSLTKVLCYYTGIDIPENLRNKVIIPRKGKIVYVDQSINNDFKKIIELKLIYLLISISYSKNSEKNYLDDDVDLSEIQNRLKMLEIIEVLNLEQEIVFKEKSVMVKNVYAIDEQSMGRIYFRKDATNIQKAEGIAEYLFENTSIKETIELILFYKDIEELKGSVDILDFEVINKKWKVDYHEKFLEFQKEILSHFEIDSIKDVRWFIYNSSSRSEFLIQLDRLGKLNLLNYIINTLKLEPKYEGYFDNFSVEINRSEIEEASAKLISFLEQKDFKSNIDKINEIKSLSRRIGVEDKLRSIEESICIEYPDYQDSSLDNYDQVLKKVNIERKVNDIFEKITEIKPKNIIVNELNQNVTPSSLPIKPKKLIFQNNESMENRVQDFHMLGSKGEEEVLIYYIYEFVKLRIEERIEGVNAVYGIIKSKTGNDRLEKYKDKCLEVISDEKELIKALIPLFYITMHHKYSYFDLIVYKNGNPTLIEVKTTESNKNNHFYLSIAELNAARNNIEYEIVRVTPSSIIFIGNPIKLIHEQLLVFNGEGFSLKPRNFEFIFNN